jgi:hypothetical protein
MRDSIIFFPRASTSMLAFCLGQRALWDLRTFAKGTIVREIWRLPSRGNRHIGATSLLQKPSLVSRPLS